MMQVLQRWAEVASTKKWTVDRNHLYGDNFDFGVAREYGRDRTQSIVLRARTPCTRR